MNNKILKRRSPIKKTCHKGRILFNLERTLRNKNNQSNDCFYEPSNETFCCEESFCFTDTTNLVGIGLNIAPCRFALNANRRSPIKKPAIRAGYYSIWGERWGSNPRQPVPQTGALPTELHSPSEQIGFTYKHN